MKTLGRILIILVAALLVVGATMAFAQAGGLSSLPGGRGEHFRDGQRPPQFTNDGAARPFGSGDRHEGGLSGLTQIIKSLGLIGGITLVVVAATKTSEWFHQWRKRRPAVTTYSS